MDIKDEVEKTIKNYESQTLCLKCNEYENAIETYKQLVNTGMIKPRENSLLPIEKRFNEFYQINK